MKIDRELKRIVDFQDFNYERVAFDINFMTKEERNALKERLRHDYVNKLYRFDNAYYFAIWNSDFQDFKRVEDIYFDSDNYDYVIVRLNLIDGKWYYKITQHKVVEEDKRF